MAKVKAKSTSKLKLKNKFANKQMKSSRLYKLNKKVGTKKTINIPKQQKNAKKADNFSLKKDSFDPYDEELQFSDEEMEKFVNENSAQLSFLSTNLSR